MKLRKLIASIAASAVAATSLAAVSGAYEAWLMYTDGNWAWGNWNPGDFAAGEAEITSDGTYTVYIDNTASSASAEDDETGDLVPVTATSTHVFCVDIEGLSEALGIGTAGSTLDSAGKMQLAKDAGVDVTDVTVTTTSTDGTSQSFDVDESKIFFGDIEGNGKFRIELVNEYGSGTYTDAPFDFESMTFDQKIAVTFTITGVGAPAAEETVTATGDTTTTAAAGDVDAATDSSKGSPDTGIADAAAVAGIAVIAAGALVVAKKRK